MAEQQKIVVELAAEAISDFADVQSWQVEQIKEAVRQADAGGTFVSHERVAAWVWSLGTGSPLLKPGA